MSRDSREYSRFSGCAVSSRVRSGEDEDSHSEVPPEETAAEGTNHDYRLLPPWAYVKLVSDLTQISQVTMRHAARPTIVWLGVALYLTLKDISIFLLALFNTTCEGSTAVYPPWLWSVFIPFALPLLFIEFMCSRFAMIPYFQSVGTLGYATRICGRTTCGYVVYMCVSGCKTLVQILDGGSDGMFVATTWATYGKCPGRELKNEIWSRVMDTSQFYRFSEFVSVRGLAFACWILPFGAIVYALLFTLPVREDCEFFLCVLENPVCDEHQLNRYRSAQHSVTSSWRNLFGDEVVSGDVLPGRGLGPQLAGIPDAELSHVKSRGHQSRGHAHR